MNTINLPIQDFQKEPIQIWIYDRAKKTYVKAIKILGIIFLSILLLSTALVWVTLLYLILYSSNVRLESKLKKFRERNADASRSKELFDFYKATLNFKSVFEEEGDFRYP
ncbi:MAG: hypothetical protein PF450_02015 [Bacteroidales bacterium]|jgi:hypothetical protein|nr:hypothetical protein [Bacteroidales bacterium]